MRHLRSGAIAGRADLIERAWRGLLPVACALCVACGGAGEEMDDAGDDGARPGVGESAPPIEDAQTDSGVPGSPQGDAAAAADVIRGYYDAIDARDYARAYGLWSDSGRASGQTLESFAAGFEGTASTGVEIGAPGRIEGAAGSRYVEIPVVIRATTTSGVQQRFAGSYTLRRSVVDGATAEQRAWRIHSASVRATTG